MWDECGMKEHCQNTCIILGQKPSPICPENCTASYACIDGYVRTSENNRTCITEEYCGKQILMSH